MTLTRATTYVNETKLVVNEVLQAMKMIKTIVGYHVTEWTWCFCRSGEKKMHSYYICYVKMFETTGDVRTYQCQSKALLEEHNEIYQKVMNLESLRVQKLCYNCLPLYHKPHKKLQFKGLLHKQVVLGESIQVACTSKRPTINDEIRWVKDNSRFYDAGFNSLGTGPVERHIGVDTLGELLISKVIAEDKGVYACFVNGEPVLKLVVKVLPQDVTETKGE